MARQGTVPAEALYAFARELRELRRRAPGSPSYETLAARSGWPSAALREAAEGTVVPRLDAVLAFVAACGGDTEEWWRRWAGLHVSLRGAAGAGAPSASAASAASSAAPAHPFAPDPFAPDPFAPGPALAEHVTPGLVPPGPALSGPALSASAPSGPVPGAPVRPGTVPPEPVPPVPAADASYQPPAPIDPGYAVGAAVSAVSDGTAAPLRPEDPRQVGPFGLLGRLPAGTLGEVFLGAGPGGGLVAVRLLAARPAGGPGFRRRLAAEISAASRVRGPHSPAVAGAGAWDDRPWIATAYVPGPTLAEAVALGGPLPGPSVRELASTVAQALDAHHRVGVRHRAIGPHNVRLGPGGPATLDFGLARTVDVARLAAEGRWETAAFLAPEQVKGCQGAPSADVFSLGSLLAYAATGLLPFGDGSTGDLLRRIAAAQPLPSALAVADGRLRDLIAACLDADPARRPTAQQVADACDGYAPGAPPTSALSCPAPEQAAAEGDHPGASVPRGPAHHLLGLVPVLVVAAAALAAALALSSSGGRSAADRSYRTAVRGRAAATAPLARAASAVSRGPASPDRARPLDRQGLSGRVPA